MTSTGGGWQREAGDRGCKVTPFSLIECCRNVRTVLPDRQRGLIIAHNKAILEERLLRCIAEK